MSVLSVGTSKQKLVKEKRLSCAIERVALINISKAKPPIPGQFSIAGRKQCRIKGAKSKKRDVVKLVIYFGYYSVTCLLQR